MTPKEKAKELVNKFNKYTVIETIHFPNGKVIEGYYNINYNKTYKLGQDKPSK